MPLVIKLPKEAKYLLADPDAPLAALRDFQGKIIVYVTEFQGPSLDDISKNLNAEFRNWEIGDGLGKHYSGYVKVSEDQLKEILKSKRAELSRQMTSHQREFI